MDLKTRQQIDAAERHAALHKPQNWASFAAHVAALGYIILHLAGWVR